MPTDYNLDQLDSITGANVKVDTDTFLINDKSATSGATGSGATGAYKEITTDEVSKALTGINTTDLKDSFTFLIGATLDTPDVTVASDGATITLSLEKMVVEIFAISFLMVCIH